MRTCARSLLSFLRSIRATMLSHICYIERGREGVTPKETDLKSIEKKRRDSVFRKILGLLRRSFSFETIYCPRALFFFFGSGVKERGRYISQYGIKTRFVYWICTEEETRPPFPIRGCPRKYHFSNARGFPRERDQPCFRVYLSLENRATCSPIYRTRILAFSLWIVSIGARHWEIRRIL